ncbi:MAG TPA: cupin domain-containing protein, partial [Clostridiales bacterium]|nr:cupin domain-containing protein [Clostridiales bacterium]
MVLTDYGPEPFAINIEQATKQNNAFRTALWTGNHLQLTLMSISPGEDIGLENHPDNDQFLRIEQGRGLVKMGESKDN